MKVTNLAYKLIFVLAAVSILLVSSLFFFYLNPYSRNAFKAALIMPEFIQKNKYAGWDQILKFKPLTKLTKQPVVKTVTIESAHGPIIADLWLPVDRRTKHGAVIVTLGIEIDRKDSRSTFIANNIARSGVAVLLPEVPNLLAGRVESSEAEELIASFQYLEIQPFIKKDKIGFLSFCGASTISLLAAEDLRIADKVAYVAINNVYYTTRSLAQAMVAKNLIDSHNRSFVWRANYKTVKVLNREYIEGLTDNRDKEILIDYLVNQSEATLYLRNFPQIPANQLLKLSDDGQKTYRFLTNNDPSQFDELYDQLPKSVIDFLSKTTATANLGNLKAPLFIIADRGNSFQPFTDSEKLISQLPNHRITFVETDILKDGFLAQDLNFKQAFSQGLKILFFSASLLAHAS